MGDENDTAEQVEDVAVEPQDNTPVAASTSTEPALSDFWNPVMELIPAEFHKSLTPKFREWDKNYTQKTQEYSGTLAQYEPYKPIIESGLPVEQLQAAMDLANMLETQPAETIQELLAWAQSSGIWQGDTQTPAEPDSEQGLEEEIPDITKHPEFRKMQEMLESIEAEKQANREAEEAAEADAAVAKEISDLTEAHGDFDVDWVLTKAMTAMTAGEEVESLEPFVLEYQQWLTDQLVKANVPAPKILGGGGSAASGVVEKRGPLGEKDRMSLIKQMLTEAATVNQ